MKALVWFGQLLLFLALLAAVPVTAGTASSCVTPGVQILHSTPSSLEIEYRPRVDGFDTVVVSGVTTVLPRIAGASIDATAAPGSPTTLLVRLSVSVPSESGFRLEQ